MKPFYKSLTFWSLILTLLGLVLAGVGQGRPLIELLSDVEVQATLGEVLTGLGIGGALVGRARAQGPLTRGKGDESGSVQAGLILTSGGIACVVLVLLYATSGCGPIQVRAEREITWQRRPGPTCYVRTLADGEVATESTAPTSCVPPPSFCQPGPGEPGYVAPERSF